LETRNIRQNSRAAKLSFGKRLSRFPSLLPQPLAQAVFQITKTGKPRSSGKSQASRKGRAGAVEQEQAAGNGGTMGSIKKWMLGAALAAGIVGMNATPAQAARVHVGVYVGAPGYVAPYPGPGYVWVNGYWANGYWVPGYWNYVGVGPVFRGGIVIGHGHYYGRHYGHRW
jgi:hypothetical protein